MTDAISTGETPPPEPEFIRTPRFAKTLTHRLVALCPTVGVRPVWPGSERSAWAVLSPYLEHWAGEVIGDPKRWSIGVKYEVEGAGKPLLDTLVDFSRSNLAALDIVLLATGPGELARSLGGLAHQITQALNPRITELSDIVPQVELGRCEEAMLAALHLHELLSRARALTSADLLGVVDVAPAAVAVDERTLGALAERLSNAVEALDTAVAKNTGLEDAMAGLAGFGLRSAIANPGVRTVDAARALFVQAGPRVDAFKSGASDEERVLALIGARMPTPTALGVADREAIVNNLRRSAERFSSPGEVALWVRQSARARQRLRTLTDIADVSPSAQLAEPLFSYQVLQWPDVPGETWIGAGAPETNDTQRTSVVLAYVRSLEKQTDLSASDTVCGLLIDTWAERLPNPDTTSGIAFHFDSPGARAPQTILIATPGEGTSWSFNVMCDLLYQTLCASQQRAVDPETSSIN